MTNESPSNIAVGSKQLGTKRTFADVIDQSTRTVDRYIEANLIPFYKLPAVTGKDGKQHGRVLIPIADALAALGKFRVAALGEIPAGLPHGAPRRRMQRMTPTITEAN